MAPYYLGDKPLYPPETFRNVSKVPRTLFQKLYIDLVLFQPVCGRHRLMPLDAPASLERLNS